MLKKIILFVLCFSLFPVTCYAMPLSCVSGIVICADTNQVLFGKEIHKKMSMASTTKIMTAIIALENAELSDTVLISSNASRQEGSSIYLKSGDKVTLSHLLYGLMLNSGNDAAMAIAEHISKTPDEFVTLMNKKADELGLSDTHFENPSGLPDKEHYSTAYDMAMLMSYALKNQVFAEIVATKEYKIEGENSVTHLRNHNKLLWKYPFATGGKTGFTKSAGRCFVSSARKDGVTLVAVTLDAPDDWNDHIKLLDYGFEKAPMTEVIEKHRILSTEKINGTRVNLLSYYTLFLPLKNGKKHPVTCEIRLDSNLKETQFGSHLGFGDIYVDNFYVGSIDLISGYGTLTENSHTFWNAATDVIKKLFLGT